MNKNTNKNETANLIKEELNKVTEKKSSMALPDAVESALLPPIQIDIPKPHPLIEEKFSLTLNNVPAVQFFMAIVAGTRYSMLVHPEVSGMVSANLKNVTMFEALDAIRELYGYDYKIEGTRIYIKPLTLQTRVFQVNYLTGNRRGTSDIRVSSGSVGDVAGSTGTGSTTNAASNTLNNSSQNQVPGSMNSNSVNTSKISTTSNSDFWAELKEALEAIVGNSEGRSVVISPQPGIVVVRAMWDELRNVAAYLKATQLAVDRQVILEAKILEVQLNDGFQTGINWASFASMTGVGNNRAVAGWLGPGSTLSSAAHSTTLTSQGNTGLTANTNLSLNVPASAPGSLFGLAFQTNNFAALISFLETQGTVHVLSSPRIATLNNQKAVLKVGRDEFFVTGFSSTTTTGTATTTTPNVTLQPFFSGISLDVTPQIAEDGGIILHVHPSVVNVASVDKNINLGSGGALILPLASSTVSETDSIVRGQDGQIVAIGGLMRQSAVEDRSQIPGAGDIPVAGALFRNTNKAVRKHELVILLKPTVVQGDNTWTNDILGSQQRIDSIETSRTLKLR